MTRLLVVDDHALFRSGIVSLLKARGYDVVGEAADGLSAVSKALDLRPAVEVQLLRIAQEALANARKHAKAGCARVVLSMDPKGSRLVVEDDGQGFDPQNLVRGPWPHLGLQSMQERAAAVGARFTLDTAPGKGTKVIVDLPNTAQEAT